MGTDPPPTPTPPGMDFEREFNENFWYTFDVSNNYNIEYQGSLKLSAEMYLMCQMETIKKLVATKSLRMTFHGQAAVATQF